MLAVRLVVALAGAVLVVWTIWQAVRTFLVPRPLPVPFARAVFVGMRHAFRLGLRAGRVSGAAERDAVMAHYAPVSLAILPFMWLLTCAIGYVGLLWSIDDESLRRAVIVSGSSLLTLGFAVPGGLPATLIAFSEALVGLALLALVISYLPTIYGAYQRRETVVAMLDARAGSPPTAVTLLERGGRYAGFVRLDAQWTDWERWIVDVGESHTTHAMLAFFRSAEPARSWVTAAVTLLDAANLRMAAISLPGSGNHDAWMLIQAGTRALVDVARFFQLPVDGGGCSVTREELDEALRRLAAAELPLEADRDVIWQRFATRRAGYDRAALGLCALLEAAPAPWSADRAPVLEHLPPILRQRRRQR